MELTDKGNNWKPILTNEVTIKIEECVREVANRLHNPKHVRESVNDILMKCNKTNQESFFFVDTSLASGYPGACLLFGEMDRMFPNESWDIIGYEHMVEIQHAINNQSVYPLSLWYGLAGIGMAARSLSRNGERYNKFTSQLNDLLLLRLPILLKQANNNISLGVGMADFDIVQGMTGIGRYLLFYSEQSVVKEHLSEILQYLVAITGKRKVANEFVPSWYIPTSNLIHETEKIKYPKGNFNVGFAHGITGPLAMLSLSLINHIEVSGQRKAIREIAEWLIKWKQEDKYGSVWPQFVSWDEYMKEKIESKINSYEAWCYGSPGIARALWLAGNALNVDSWRKEAIESYIGTLRREEHKWNITSPTFCHGLVGLLQLTQRMCVESGLEELIVLRDRLIKRTLEMYNNKLPFCFYNLEKKVNGVHKLHNPGLVSGSTGIALVLLSMISPSSPEWDAAFLIS